MRRSTFLKLMALWGLLASRSYAASENWEVGATMSTVVSGSFNFAKPHSISELSFGLHGYRKIKIKKKLFGKSQEVWVGGGFQNGDVTYTSGSITRQGYHLQFGLLSSWRIFFHKKFYGSLDFNFYPIDQVNIFSKINTISNDERISNTSHTRLDGMGWNLGISGGRNFNFKVLNVKFNIGVLPFLKFNSESFSSRYDKVFVVNQDTGSVDITETSGSAGFSSSYISLGLNINFAF